MSMKAYRADLVLEDSQANQVRFCYGYQVQTSNGVIRGITDATNPAELRALEIAIQQAWPLSEAPQLLAALVFLTAYGDDEDDQAEARERLAAFLRPDEANLLEELLRKHVTPF